MLLQLECLPLDSQLCLLPGSPVKWTCAVNYLAHCDCHILLHVSVAQLCRVFRFWLGWLFPLLLHIEGCRLASVLQTGRARHPVPAEAKGLWLGTDSLEFVSSSTDDSGDDGNSAGGPGHQSENGRSVGRL